jgi:hypothetical protein
MHEHIRAAILAHYPHADFTAQVTISLKYSVGSKIYPIQASGGTVHLSGNDWVITTPYKEIDGGTQNLKIEINSRDKIGNVLQGTRIYKFTEKDVEVHRTGNELSVNFLKSVPALGDNPDEGNTDDVHLLAGSAFSCRD